MGGVDAVVLFFVVTDRAQASDFVWCVLRVGPARLTR